MPPLTISVEPCAVEQILDEMHIRTAGEGVTITREQLRVKVAAAYGPGRRARRRRAHFVSGQEVDWPPIANKTYLADLRRLDLSRCVH